MHMTIIIIPEGTTAAVGLYVRAKRVILLLNTPQRYKIIRNSGFSEIKNLAFVAKNKIFNIFPIKNYIFLVA